MLLSTVAFKMSHVSQDNCQGSNPSRRQASSNDDSSAVGVVARNVVVKTNNQKARMPLLEVRRNDGVMFVLYWVGSNSLLYSTWSLLLFLPIPFN